MVAFLINISVISVSGAVCNSSHLSTEDQNNCVNLDLNKAPFLLEVRGCQIYKCSNRCFLFWQNKCKYFMQFIVYFTLYTECANHPNAFWLWFYYFLQNVLGSWSSKLFAIALLASGQSSTITGTYAGQYVMQVSC